MGGEAGGEHDAVDVAVGRPGITLLMGGLQPERLDVFLKGEEAGQAGEMGFEDRGVGEAMRMPIEGALYFFDGMQTDGQSELAEGEATGGGMLQGGVPVPSGEAGGGFIQELFEAI